MAVAHGRVPRGIFEVRIYRISFRYQSGVDSHVFLAYGRVTRNIFEVRIYQISFRLLWFCRN